MIALAAGSYRPFTGGARRHGASSTFVDVTFSLVVAIAICLLLVATFVLLSLRARGKFVPSAGPSVVRTLLVLALTLGLVAFLGRDIRHRFQRQSQESGEQLVLRPGSGQPATSAARPEGHRPQVIWPLALSVGGLIAAALVAALVLSRRREEADELSEEALAEVRAVLTEAIEDLRHEPDVRKAVIAAYARMEAVLASHRLGRRPAETPHEYLARIERELRARRSLAALTELFERAKFSLLAVDESMRADAISALTAVRDEVRATA